MRRILVVTAVGGFFLGCGADAEPAPTAEPPRVVAVNWLGRGVIYAAQIAEERGEMTSVIYADGDREWVTRDRLAPWPDLLGQQVQYWSRGAAHDVTVRELRDALYHVQLADGGDTWIAPDMLYRLTAPASAPAQPPPTAATFALRQPVDPSTLREGQTVLAYWIQDGELRRERPWRARITAMNGDAVSLRYVDDSEATVPRAAILRILSPARRSPEVGVRHWLWGEAPVGTVVETRAGLARVRSGEGTPRWVDTSELFEPVAGVDPAALVPEATITVLWGDNALYHATVRARTDAAVIVAWHDGSDPSPVPVADVLEIWSPVH